MSGGIVLPVGSSPIKMAKDARVDIVKGLVKAPAPVRAWHRAHVIMNAQDYRPHQRIWHLTCRSLATNAALASSAVWLVVWGLEVNMLRGGITGGGGQKAEACALFMDVKTGVWTTAVAERNVYLLDSTKFDTARWGARRQEFITTTLAVAGRKHDDRGERGHLDSIVSRAVAEMKRQFNDPALRDFIVSEMRATREWGHKLRMGRLKRLSLRTGRMYYQTTDALGRRHQEEI